MLGSVDEAGDDCLVLVDLMDRPLGSATKTEVHRRELLHRVFSVLFWRNTEQGQKSCSRRGHRGNTIQASSGPFPATRIRGMEKSSEKQSCAGSMRSWGFQETLSRTQRITAPTSTAPSLLRTSSSMSATMSFWLAAQVSHMQTWKKRKSSAECRFGRQLMR